MLNLIQGHPQVHSPGDFMKMTFKATVCAAVLVLLCGAATFAGGSDNKPLIRVGVDTVFVNVTVVDPLNRCVTGLEQDVFRVFENKVEQKIAYFSEEEAPVSVGILFDRSGSMKANNNIEAARSAIVRFMQSANPEDEFFLVTFNQDAALVTDFTHESGSIAGEIALDQPSGRTAVYDAVYMGLQKIKKASNERKALILITDGEDNSSRYSPAEVKELAREMDVPIYGIGEQGELGYGRFDIEEIVDMTGGRAFFPNSFNELDYYIDLIHAELRNQYVLGYVPSNKAHDGKWRRIQVKLDAPQGLPRLVVRSREGYYASK